MCIKSTGQRVKKHIHDSNVPFDMVNISSCSEISQWKLLKPKVDITYWICKMSVTNPVLLEQNLSEIKQLKYSTIDIYTYGSDD